MPILTNVFRTFASARHWLCAFLLLTALYVLQVFSHQPLPGPRLVGRCRAASHYQRQIPLSLLMLCLLSPWLLYGCGTAPLSVQTQPPVPAELMQPPQKPTLLAPKAPGSTWTTPGETTPSTPVPVRSTGLGTRI